MGLGLRMGMDPPLGMPFGHGQGQELGLGLGLAWLGLSQQRQKGEVLNRNSPFLVGAKINLAEI